MKQFISHSDGIHSNPEKKSIEWWYFDFEFEDGTIIIVSFFTKYYFNASPGIKPKAHIFIKYPNGTYITQSSINNKKLKYNFAKEKLDIQIGDSFAYEKDGEYYCCFNSRNVKFEGVMYPNKNVKSMDKNLTHKEKDKSFGWQYEVPTAASIGKLSIRKTIYEGKGLGYHDHNWCDSALGDLFSSWQWFRVISKDESLIFFYLFTKSNETKQCCLIEINKSGYKLNTDLNIEFNGETDKFINIISISTQDKRWELCDYKVMIKGEVSMKFGKIFKPIYPLLLKYIQRKGGGKGYERMSFNINGESGVAEQVWF